MYETNDETTEGTTLVGQWEALYKYLIPLERPAAEWLDLTFLSENDDFGVFVPSILKPSIPET